MLELIRYWYRDSAVQGILLKDGVFICDTLERPWLNNAHLISCIPEGQYNIQYREDETAHVKVGYEVLNVPNRTQILIHVANYVSQLAGCIGVGIKCGDAVNHSLEVFNELHQVVGDTATLNIRRI